MSNPLKALKSRSSRALHADSFRHLGRRAIAGCGATTRNWLMQIIANNHPAKQGGLLFANTRPSGTILS
jgi:hypothetical protein